MTDEIIHAGTQAGAKKSRMPSTCASPAVFQPEKQLQLAMFLASERSNHVSGKLIHVNDDWKRLEHGNINPAAYTLRRVTKG